MTLAREVLAGLLAAVEAGGGVAVAIVMLAENLFPPIPSEAVLPLAGYAVHTGRVPFAVVLAAATTGSVAGALVLYAAGRFGGRPLLQRHRWLLRLEQRHIERANAWFDRHGQPLVFWARMVPLARSGVSVPAGMAEMPVGRFLALTTAGSLVWNAALTSAGMLLGARWGQVSAAVGAYGQIVVAVAVVVGASALLMRQRRSASRRRAPSQPGA